MGRPKRDITGQKFGWLTAIEPTNRQKPGSGIFYWKCRCDCGRIVEVSLDNLHSGRQYSCGCSRNRRYYE